MSRISPSPSSSSLIEMDRLIEIARQPQESSEDTQFEHSRESLEDTQSEHSAVPERDSCLARVVSWLKEEHAAWGQCNLINIIFSSVSSLGSFISARTGGKRDDGIMQPSLSGDIVASISFTISSLLTLKTIHQMRKARASSDPDVRSYWLIKHKIANWQILTGIVGAGCGIASLFIYPTKEDKN